MPFNRIYSTALWLLYVAGAPVLTAALAIITIPLLLTEPTAGVVLLLLPGILTLAPLVGVANPGNVPRDAYVPATFLGLVRILVPAIIWAAWFSYFEGDAREGQALALALIVSGTVSAVIWAWSVDQFLTVAPYLDSTTPRAVVARRVEIEPALELEERKAMLAARERHGRIDRAIAATRPQREGDSSAVVTFPAPEKAGESSTVGDGKESMLARFRWRRAPRPSAEPSPPSENGAAPAPDNGRGDVFTGNRDRD
ncbi:MAG TPA: hypothetical protein VFO84_10945 [Dehalococcoidia bacterium]|nr:hypothetical protein [Dehalococcoidia bacterium]